jgi:hypothetical protein
MTEVWKSLSSLYTKRIKGPSVGSAEWQKLGTAVYESTATIKADREFSDFFPTAAILRDGVQERLPPAQMRSADPMFRFAVELPMTVGRRILSGRVIFEPRYSADNPHVFFTSSPLRSDQHLGLLELLFSKKPAK